MEQTLLVLSLLFLGAFCDLPTDFTVTSYDLSLNVPSSINTAVEGSVKITLSCKKDTSSIVLHWGSSLSPATPTATEITINYTSPDPGSTPAPVTGFTSPVDAYNKLTISKPPASGSQSFLNGGVVVVVAKFKTTINADKGLVYRQYLNDNRNNTILMTNLRPTYARELFPCLDEPMYTGMLTLTLTYPDTWSVAATTTEKSSSVGPTAGTTTKVFNSIEIPANAFALFLADNMNQNIVDVGTTGWTMDRSPTKLSFWCRKGLSTSTFSAIVRYIAEFYYNMEDVIGITMPQTTSQITIVLVPGLEEPIAGYGVLFIREYNYAQDYFSPQAEGLFKSNVAPLVELFIRQFTEFSTRPSTWSDHWVCQSTAKYIQYMMMDLVVPFFGFKADLEVVARQTSLYLDSQPDSKALQDTSVSTDSAASVKALVNDPLKSLKGAVILNMLDQSFPAGTVITAIKTFLTKNQNTIITSTTFYEAIQSIKDNGNLHLSDNAKAALTTVNTWFSNAVYPLEAVKVYKTGTPGTVNFTTTGFCSIVNPSCTSDLPTTYYVPATVGSKSDNRYFTPRQGIWAYNKDKDNYISTSINVGDADWTVANMKSGGYYRSSYDADNWERIISAILTKDSRLIGRSQLLDDAFALAQSTSALNYNITIRLTLANLGNTLFSDWYPVHRGLQSIRDIMLNLSIYSSYKNFAAGFFLNLDRFMQNSSTDAFEKARIQALFIDDFCEYDIPGYRASAVGNLTDLLKGILPSTVPSSAYDALACCGARYNPNLKAQPLWDTLIDRRLSYYNRRFAAIALGCLSNYTDIKQLYNTMTDTNPQYNHYIVITLQQVAERNAVDFLADFCPSVDKFQTRLGATTVASLLLRAGRKVNNNTQAAVLDTVNDNANVDALVKAAAKTTTNLVGSKVTWLANNNASLVIVLQSHTLPSGGGTNSSAKGLTVISLLVFLYSLLYTLAPLCVH